MAGGPNGGKGGLGWLILAAALAVPGFLFYNWWSHLKAERDHAISAKASKLAAGGVFQTPPPAAGRLVNPMAASTSAPSGMPPVLPGATASTGAPAAAAPALAGVAPGLTPGTAPLVPATGAAPTAAVPGATQAAGAGLAPAAAPMMGQAPTGQVPMGQAPTGQAPTGGAAPSATPTITLTRDPMMSPMDLVRLQEEEIAKEAAAKALAEANKPHPEKIRRRPAQPPIERKIELQGIVAKPDGDNLAIINGTTINPGESFTVEHYKGKVKVLKITSSEVVLDYNGRKIRLSVNVE